MHGFVACDESRAPVQMVATVNAVLLDKECSRCCIWVLLSGSTRVQSYFQYKIHLSTHCTACIMSLYCMHDATVLHAWCHCADSKVYIYGKLLNICGKPVCDKFLKPLEMSDFTNFLSWWKQLCDSRNVYIYGINLQLAIALMHSVFYIYTMTINTCIKSFKLTRTIRKINRSNRT